MELLDVVDEEGRPTGRTVTREKAHAEGIRHRTSHVWIVGIRAGVFSLLLQKRAADKDSYPGCYDISSAGHIPAGEGFAESALRELQEELGIPAAREELQFIGQRTFSFEKEFHGVPFRDCQVSNVYLLHRETEAEAVVFQKSEIERVCWMPFTEVVRMVRDGTPENCIRMEELDMIRKAEQLSEEEIKK